MDRRAVLATVGLLSGCGGRRAGGSDDATPRATRVSATTASGTTVAGSTTEAAAESTRDARRPPLTGASLSPKSYDGADFRRFFDETAALGPVVRWAGKWSALGDDGSGAHAVAELADRFGYVPVVEVGVKNAASVELFRPLDEATTTEYVELARDFASKHRPPYVAMGVEVNLLASDAPDAFERFVSLYARAREAIADVSPETKTYTVFQLEWCRGLRGGLWGDPDPGADPQWDLLERFETDCWGFTTYPGLVHRDPGDVPADYYASVAERTDVPLAFTEVGWPAGLDVSGWESDEREQTAFVDRLFDLLEPTSVELLLWAWLYAQGDPPASFAGTGLRRPDGSARPAYDAWVERASAWVPSESVAHTAV